MTLNNTICHFFDIGSSGVNNYLNMNQDFIECDWILRGILLEWLSNMLNKAILYQPHIPSTVTNTAAPATG